MSCENAASFPVGIAANVAIAVVINAIAASAKLQLGDAYLYTDHVPPAQNLACRKGQVWQEECRYCECFANGTLRCEALVCNETGRPSVVAQGFVMPPHFYITAKTRHMKHSAHVKGKSSRPGALSRPHRPPAWGGYGNAGDSRDFDFHDVRPFQAGSYSLYDDGDSFDSHEWHPYMRQKKRGKLKLKTAPSDSRSTVLQRAVQNMVHSQNSFRSEGSVYPMMAPPLPPPSNKAVVWGQRSPTIVNTHPQALNFYQPSSSLNLSPNLVSAFSRAYPQQTYQFSSSLSNQQLFPYRTYGYFVQPPVRRAFPATFGDPRYRLSSSFAFPWGQIQRGPRIRRSLHPPQNHREANYSSLPSSLARALCPGFKDGMEKPPPPPQAPKQAVTGHLHPPPPNAVNAHLRSVGLDKSHHSKRHPNAVMVRSLMGRRLLRSPTVRRAALD